VLLSLQDVSVAFGGPPVLDAVSCAITSGERVALVGRNGAGKSTLMKVLDGSLTPDSGEVVRQGGVTVTRLDQAVPEDLSGTLFDVVAGGLGEAGLLLSRYHEASLRLARESSDSHLRALDRLHHALEAADAWQMHTRVESALERLSLDPDLPFAEASGGRKRQALLARALVAEPDLLLLDEPTNHLDIEAIEWMEEFLLGQGLTLLFVTHDRAFLRRLATRILELDRGRLMDWGADYDTYLERRDAAMAAEQGAWDEFDRKLAIEEVWIRTGIQARRTRNEGRVRALESMRRERSARRERVGTVKLTPQEGERSGRLVVEAQVAGFSYGPTPVVRDLSTTIMRGDRVGLVGPNGSGKTTLLRLLLGELSPDQGDIRFGTGLQIAYFDQLRDQLDPDRTVFENIADGADFVQLASGRQHVNGYLQGFLFSADRARTPVRALSGGERNRLLLARLFTRSFNVLALDEPTNDLDAETLDLLEELLLEFTGTLLLVSHDRAFLDAVVTSTLVLEGKGRVGEYAGGYSDLVRQRAGRPTRDGFAGSAFRAPASPRLEAGTPQGTPTVGSRRRERPRKLSFREQHELASLPDAIDTLEHEREGLYAQLADPVFLRDGVQVIAARARLDEIDRAISAAMARWEELEGVAANQP